MWYNNSDKSRRPDRSLFSSWPILQKEQKMNRKEKFKQANREANATWLALLIVIFFWCVAGFGLADVKVEIFQTPLWVWAGCIGTWLFAIVVSVVLANCIFKDMDLDDKEDEING